MNADWFKLAN